MVFLFGCRPEKTVDYNVDVKPILNKRCISCHGGVKQSGGFSLLTREQALASTETGLPAIRVGKAHTSEMIKRLKSDDPEWRMPLDGDPLPPEEIEILEKWIDEGLEWELHWSYRPVEKITPPEDEVLLGVLGNSRDSVPVSPLDQFVIRKLNQMGISSLSPEADRHILVRRASLDLIGMPAPGGLAEKYLNGSSPQEDYEGLIDSLLSLPSYGEKWASMWLDIARYADSKGFERDPHRNIWEYRDWVIRAFNQDMPYDQFITEQIAGDLLPQPTEDQLIATAFHRNTSTNDEGGTDNEEFRNYAVMDRVNTTWEGIMGTTFACVQCHSHPYDPFMHEEYYEFLAFFNNTRDADTSPDYPLLRHFRGEDSTKLEQWIDWAGTKVSEQEVDELEAFIKTWSPSWYSIETDSFFQSDLYDTKYLGLRQDGGCRLPNVELEGNNLMYFRYRTSLEDGRWNLHSAKTNQLVASVILPSTNGKWSIMSIPLSGTFRGSHDLIFSYHNPNLVDPDQAGVMFDWFHFGDERDLWKENPERESDFMDLLGRSVSTTPIMVENPPEMRRTTRIFDRGNWLVQTEKVEPAVPDIFPNLDDTTNADRLDLAHWLVNEQNPLTARTLVNRIWAQVFGRGIVETVEDLGSQSPDPSHPELLDWLAWELMNTYEWHLKPFLKMILMSSTYRQQSITNDILLEKDPYNIYLTRGPRVRLSAEQLRDQALTLSGLINTEMYGPSVMPYQPIGWNIPYSNEQWKTSSNGQQYRRAVYTYWKRSAPYPAMMIFDAAAREVCEARRIQTNTPLHALVTLNDPVYFEAASHLAIQMWQEGDNLDTRINTGYQRALGVPVTNDKASALADLYFESLASFDRGESDPVELLTYLDDDNEELAAMVVVANAIMNMDEFVTKN